MKILATILLVLGCTAPLAWSRTLSNPVATRPAGQ